MRLPGPYERRWVERDSVYPGKTPSYGSMSTIAMTEEEKKAATKSQRRPFGFHAQAPAEPDSPRKGLLRFER